jgi:hypothetical protein
MLSVDDSGRERFLPGAPRDQNASGAAATASSSRRV